MRIVTEKDAARLKGALAHWAYNALDCCTTAGVFEALVPLLTPTTERTYAFERACQAPAMAMMRRGILVDVRARDRAVKRVGGELKAQLRGLNDSALVKEKWDGVELETGKCKSATRKDGRHKWPLRVPDAERSCVDCGAPRLKPEPFNAASWQQTWHLFYDLLGVPKQKNKKRVVSVDEECLDRIARKFPKVRDLARGIIAVKGTSKQLGFLKSKLSAAGRMHSTFNVGAAWTGRWSASKDPYKRGTNTQNIAEKNRAMFIADPGMKLGYFDLSQSDSRVVAYDAEDEAYISAHESGNVHLAAARIFWPDDLPWTGNVSVDKKMVKSTPLPWHPDLMYYDQSKRNQHGLNFGLSPHGLAMHSHQPLVEAERAYDRYFEWAPRVKAWQTRIIAEVRETGVLTNPLGRRCQFFGMRDDPHTHKQGLAFTPQSMTADVLNIALWHVWKHLDPAVQLLAQVHDAILFQFKEEREEDITAAVMRYMEIKVPMRGGRTMVIPVEPSTGWNWGKKSEINPRGMS